MIRWYSHGLFNLGTLNFVFAIIPRLPKWLHPPIAVVTTLIVSLFLWTEYRAVFRNISIVNHGSTAEHVWKTFRVFYSFCDFIVSYCYVPCAKRTELLGFLTEDCEYGSRKIRECLSEENGVIVWTAHLGNWELGSRLLERFGTKVNIVRLIEADNPADLFLRNIMVNDLLRVVEINGNGLPSLELLNALRRNEIVAIQGDRVYGPSWETVSFFGQPVKFPLGPFMLAYVSGAPIIPGFVIREKWLRYREVVAEPIYLPRTGNRSKDLRVALERAVRVLESILDQHNDQWLNFYDYWPKDDGLEQR